MRIDTSSIAMSSTSEHVEYSYQEETLKMRQSIQPQQPLNPLAGVSSDILDITDTGKALSKQAALSSGAVGSDNTVTFELSEEDKRKLYLIQKMLEALTHKRIKFVVLEKADVDKDMPRDPGLGELKLSLKPGGDIRPQRAVSRELAYKREEIHYEKQSMSFSAEGIVRTSDGREIGISLNLNMSREFASRLDISATAAQNTRMDPLVLNFGSPSAALTEKKYDFDIDLDGTAEQISFVSGGSGFLALDLNSDGKINDGSELFGPQSGNGFSDLALYDGDKNGWIDENDSIYDRLRIWTKNGDGNDRLLALGQIGIGAICLGSVSTEYDLKTSTNQSLGDIARTGIFLREDGSAGTIQHIDLAI